MAAPFLPVSAPAVIASRPKSMPIKKMAAETDATLATATSSWNDRPMITSTATVTASRAACVAIAAAFLLRHDGGAADWESSEQAERAVLVLTRQAGRAVTDRQQQHDEGGRSLHRCCR